MLDAANLPDDIAALKAMLIAAQAREVRKDERIERLEKLVAAFKQAAFGRKSEKADPEQFDLALEDLEMAIAAIHAEDEADSTLEKPPPKPRAANRGSLPAHLPRVEEIIEPESLICGCGGGLHCIGEGVSERLDVIPAQFRVIVTRRPKYACRACTDGVAQAAAPARLIQAGLPTEATIAHVLVSKYADHLPLYRQVQIMSRQGVDLDRSTLADWVGRAAFELRPIFDALIADLKRSTKLFMDETRAPVGRHFLQQVSGQDGERPEQAERPGRHHAEERARFCRGPPVKKFHGVGAATAERMKRHGIETGLDLKSKSLAFLQQHFGKSGSYFYGIARGIDERQVRPDRIRKSVGAEDTFVEDIDDLDMAKSELRPLAEKVWRYCEAQEIKYSDFSQATRSRTLAAAASDIDMILETAETLLASVFPFKHPVRLLGITLSSLNTEESGQGPQLALEL